MSSFVKTILVYIAGSALLASSAYAAKACKKVRPIQGCIRNFHDIADEQKKVDQEDPSLNLKANIESIFAPVNNKLLVMNLIVRNELKISYDSSITVTFNGKVTRNAEVCYVACPGEGEIEWNSEEDGVFKAIPNGLKVGRYKFYIEN